jgi:hypothetical protein
MVSYQKTEPVEDAAEKLKLVHLPQVLNVIRAQKLSGKLTVVSETTRQATLAFKSGVVVDAKVWAGEEIIGDEAFYTLLNWKSGELLWQKGVEVVTPTIDSAQEADFYGALKQLTLRKVFVTGELSNPVITRFLEESVAPVVPAATTGGLRSSFTATLNQAHTAKVQGLPVPGGKPFNLIPPTNTLTELFERLYADQFNGYLQLYPDFESRAIITLENGSPTACYTIRQGYAEKGLVAWQQIKALETLPPYHLMIVADNVLLAYRGLLGSYTPYQDLPATHNNYRGLLATFKKGHYNGVLRFRLDGVELYELIHDGEGIGTFNIESNGYYLRSVPGGIGILLGNPQVKIDVYVTRDELNHAPLNAGISAQEADVLGGTLAVGYGLLSQLLSENTARQRLGYVSRQLASTAPFLTDLAKLQLPATPEEQEKALVGWVTNLQSQPRASVVTAFEQLFDSYLQPICLQVGSNTFHELIVRALGDERASALQKMGLKVDFFDKLPEQKTAALLVEDNPYDF